MYLNAHPPRSQLTRPCSPHSNSGAQAIFVLLRVLCWVERGPGPSSHETPSFLMRSEAPPGIWSLSDPEREASALRATRLWGLFWVMWLLTIIGQQDFSTCSRGQHEEGGEVKTVIIPVTGSWSGLHPGWVTSSSEHAHFTDRKCTSIDTDQNGQVS